MAAYFSLVGIERGKQKYWKWEGMLVCCLSERKCTIYSNVELIQSIRANIIRVKHVHQILKSNS